MWDLCCSWRPRISDSEQTVEEGRNIKVGEMMAKIRGGGVFTKQCLSGFFQIWTNAFIKLIPTFLTFFSFPIQLGGFDRF